MAIKFGDTLENQNSDYPVVDGTGNNIKGVVYLDSFTDVNLGNIPTTKRATGTIAVAKDTGHVYVYVDADTANGTNQWNDADGDGWVQTSGLADNTLGSDSTFNDGTLQDNSPAITDFTTSTTITDAIDQLNETLGSLVPSAPASWSSVYSSLSWDDVSTFNARLVEFQSDGSTAVSHLTNGNSGLTTTGGTVVSWFQGTNFTQSWTSVGDADWDLNDLAQTQLTVGISDESVQMASATSGGATLNAADNDYGGNLSISVTTGNFPATGDSAGFYTGVNGITVSQAATITDGYHILSVTDGSNPVTKTIYREANGANATTSNETLIKTANGTVKHLSGIPHFTNPTWKISFDASNIVPANALVYGVSSNQNDNKWLDSGIGNVVNAASDQNYSDISGISDNSSLKQNLSVTGYEITGVTTRSQIHGSYTMNSGDNGPDIQVRSIHGNSSTTHCTTSSSNPWLFAAMPLQSRSECFLSEDDLFNDLDGNAASDGVRVADPDAGGTYVDTPSDASSAFSAWSPEFCNAASTAVDLDPQDAIIRGTSASTMRLLWASNDFTSGFNLAADVTQAKYNDIDLSGRNSDAQYATFKFPITQAGLQFIYLKFRGSLQSSGELYVKIFDSGDSPSLVDENTGSSGWLKATAPSSGTSNGVPTVGCAAGGALSKTDTGFQNIKLDAGNQRWANGNDGHVYIRIKLVSGSYVQQLGLSDEPFTS